MTSTDFDSRTGNLIVVGASAGGVSALLQLAAQLSPNFPVPILVVLHIGAHRSILDRLMSANGPNPAVIALDNEPLKRGRIFLAPPDRHMLVDKGVIKLTHGPKENYARPAIDPLFRSVALDYGRRAIGVVLTGRLDDGAAGIRAIKDCGGTAVVQDPSEAAEPSMPLSALAALEEADHVVPLDRLAPLLHSLALQVRSVMVTPSSTLQAEMAVALGTGDGIETLKTIGAPSTFVCPDCGGTLFELNDKRLIRYRCHTGHAYTLRSLAYAQEGATDMALWTGLRTLQEKEAILRRLADVASGEEAATAKREADDLLQAANALRRVIEKAPSPGSFE